MLGAALKAEADAYVPDLASEVDEHSKRLAVPHFMRAAAASARSKLR